MIGFFTVLTLAAAVGLFITYQAGPNQGILAFSLVAAVLGSIYYVIYRFARECPDDKGGAPWRKERARRINEGRCIECGYNLTGNMSGKCPECGTPIVVENH